VWPGVKFLIAKVCCKVKMAVATLQYLPDKLMDVQPGWPGCPGCSLKALP